MKRALTYAAAAVLAVAVAFGCYRRTQDPYAESTRTAPLTLPTARPAGDRVTDKAVPKTSTLTFLAVGDIMLSRNVAATALRAKDPLLPFSGTGELLVSADFSVGNLESPFSGKDAVVPTGSLIFNAPTALAEGLVVYRFKALSLANNHALDQGPEGLNFTKTFLAERGIKAFGAGSSLEEAWRPAIVEHGGIRVGFLGASYASVNDGGKTKNEFVARTDDLKTLAARVTDLRPFVDFLVVTMHAGTEYTREPNAGQTGFAHAAVDAGADMVIGHHPHWVQPHETYRGKPIYYSLGNFIFDQMWSQETREGLVLKVTLKKGRGDPRGGLIAVTGQTELVSVEEIPVTIENYATPKLTPAKPAEGPNNPVRP